MTDMVPTAEPWPASVVAGVVVSHGRERWDGSEFAAMFESPRDVEEE